MLPRLRHRYQERGRRGRSVMLNEFCEQWQCDRKYAIKLLNGKDNINKPVGRRRGRPSVYGSEVIQVLESIWEAAQQPCGKRMKSIMPLWLPHYKEENSISIRVENQFLNVSAAQIDRLLADNKSKNKRGRCTTRPGSLLKTKI